MLLMTYDLVQNGDNQLNTEIKKKLIQKGWRDSVSYKVKSSNYTVQDSAPSTTLWKESDNPEEGCIDFNDVCYKYNILHLKERRQAIGKVICVNFNNCDNLKLL